MDAEKAVLGALFLDAACLYDLSLSPEDFGCYPHAEIFRIITQLVGEETPVDLVTVGTAARESGSIKKIGGSEYLAELVVHTPTAANAKYYADIVRRQSAIRRTERLGKELLELAREGQAADFQTVERRLLDYTSSRASTAADLSRTAIKVYEDRYNNQSLAGLSYGYSWLDRNTGGMTPGQLIIIAARPSMGKTALSLNIAKRGRGRVLFFSLETSKQSIIDRLFAEESRVNLHKIKTGRFHQQDFPAICRAASEMQGLRMTIDDQAGLSIGELSMRAKREKIRNGLDLIVVDYLQLVTAKAESRLQEISTISRSLKILAKSLEVPVIALSQLSRGVDSRENKRPTMSDLRESGQLEQDADVILFPYRDAAYCEKCRSKTCEREGHDQEADITIAKQKDGEANIRESFLWFGQTQRFEELANV